VYSVTSELLTAEYSSDIGFYKPSTGDLFSDTWNDRSACWTAWLGEENTVIIIDSPADRRNIPARCPLHFIAVSRGNICDEKTSPTPFPDKV